MKITKTLLMGAVVLGVALVCNCVFAGGPANDDPGIVPVGSSHQPPKAKPKHKTTKSKRSDAEQSTQPTDQTV